MGRKYTIEEKDGYCLVKNTGGMTLGVSDRGVLIEADGFAFKDLNRNGKLDVYEDWRLPWEDRIADLVSRLDIADIAGLMLYSIQQNVSMNDPFAAFNHYGGADETREHPWELSGQIKHLIGDERIRHITLAMVDSGEAAARWSNNLQAFAEQRGLGIPVNISSDPRHNAKRNLAEFNMGGGGDISVWPDGIGLAATFSPEIAKEFAGIASKEYRAMGITTNLSPQVDLACEPRWNRFDGTFGEDSNLSAKMARAYCDGFQTSQGEDEIKDGWEYGSVNTMVKHWPGGGACESGRDAHFGFGKYAIYPGGNFEEHLMPFTEGAFKLDGPTKSASAVMPYYSISYNQDEKNHENVGNSYSKFLINDLLRKKYGFEGVVCTDWGVTSDAASISEIMTGKCWGAEELSVEERHYKIIMAGVDQFGGNNEAAPLLRAFELGVERLGKEAIDTRYRQSAHRILRNIFRTGLMENPYLDAELTKKTVGCSAFVAKGKEAQRKSVVLLKNKNALLPLAKATKIYIPGKVKKASFDWFGQLQPEKRFSPIQKETAARYFSVADTPQEADVAIVFMDSPISQGYRNGYKPISLQYRPYTADSARDKSIAGDDRGYRSVSNTTDNENELDILLQTKEAMGMKPVIVCLSAANPVVVSEFEPLVDALIVDFSVEKELLLELVSGIYEPSALLPFQMPKDMRTVETQYEDMPFDMTPYADELGNVYDYTFGLNWGGQINDERTKMFKVSAYRRQEAV